MRSGGVQVDDSTQGSVSVVYTSISSVCTSLEALLAQI